MPWHPFEKGHEYSLEEVVTACEQRILADGVVDKEGKPQLVEHMRRSFPTTVVWAPFAKRGWGTSPFNPNCWRLAKNRPILASATAVSEPPDEEEFYLFPGERAEEAELHEGRPCRIFVNSYERNRLAREQCLQHYGLQCAVCDLEFAERYGEFAREIIHVHHLQPLSEIRHDHPIKPIDDLRPVCPNCHAVLHIKPRRTIQQIRTILGK
jgi:predicted HNH restriction endonuclease